VLRSQSVDIVPFRTYFGPDWATPPHAVLGLILLHWNFRSFHAEPTDGPRRRWCLSEIPRSRVLSQGKGAVMSLSHLWRRSGSRSKGVGSHRRGNASSYKRFRSRSLRTEPLEERSLLSVTCGDDVYHVVPNGKLDTALHCACGRAGQRCRCQRALIDGHDPRGRLPWAVALAPGWLIHDTPVSGFSRHGQFSATMPPVGSDGSIWRRLLRSMHPAGPHRDNAYSGYSGTTISVGAGAYWQTTAILIPSRLLRHGRRRPVSRHSPIRQRRFVRYTPDAGFDGVDTFSYVAGATIRFLHTATVRMTVSPVARRPVGDSYTATVGDTITLQASQPADPANDYQWSVNGERLPWGDRAGEHARLGGGSFPTRLR